MCVLLLDELREQRLDGAVLGHEQHLALQLLQAPSRPAQLREQQVLHVNQADGVVERPLAQRIAGVARGADGLQVLLDRLASSRGRPRRCAAP